MGSNELQVVLGQLEVAASQSQGLGAQFAASATPPESGQPFQATTVAVSGINAAICCAAAEFATRTQATATGYAAAAAYAHQEATAASEMAAVTQVTVV